MSLGKRVLRSPSLVLSGHGKMVSEGPKAPGGDGASRMGQHTATALKDFPEHPVSRETRQGSRSQHSEGAGEREYYFPAVVIFSLQGQKYTSSKLFI